MDSIRQRQASRNAETRDGWSCFAPHRERVTQLLTSNAASNAQARRLCVLGAGNCNDLALDRVASSFAHVDLVGLDGVALAEGVRRQKLATDRIELHGDVDVTGVATTLSSWSHGSPPTNSQIDECTASAMQAKLPLESGGYSVVASVCLLSQLIESITCVMAETHPRFLELITTVRREHLRQLMELAKPGGHLVLITDVVSSVTCPELADAVQDILPTILGNAISQRNFFTGVNPFVLQRLLETDAAFASGLADVHLSNPWVWDLGPRLYAVCALTATRA